MMPFLTQEATLRSDSVGAASWKDLCEHHPLRPKASYGSLEVEQLGS